MTVDTNPLTHPAVQQFAEQVRQAFIQALETGTDPDDTRHALMALALAIKLEAEGARAVSRHLYLIAEQFGASADRAELAGAGAAMH